MTVPRSTRSLVLLSATLTLCGLLLHGQEPAAVPAKPAPARPAAARPSDDDDRPARPRRLERPVGTPMPVATPIPRKRGFFDFFRRPRPTPKPTPRPTPAATPTPFVKPRSTPRPPKKIDEGEPPKPHNKPDKPKVTEVEPPATPRVKVTPLPKDIKQLLAFKDPTKSPQEAELALANATKRGDPDEIEKAKYDFARARALGDEQVRELRAKAEATTSEDEGRKALRAYNRALFEKMRKLEPDITERIDQMQAAVLKGIGGED